MASEQKGGARTGAAKIEPAQRMVRIAGSMHAPSGYATKLGAFSIGTA